MSREPDFGPLLHKFEVGADDQRALFFVRSLSALLALGGATLLFLANVPLAVFLAALLAALISLVWLAQARRARNMEQHASDFHLCVFRAGFVVTEGTRSTAVPFAEVEDVAVDEERLDIVVKRRAGTLLRLEPRYAGVEIHELVRTLQDAMREDARGRVPQTRS